MRRVRVSSQTMRSVGYEPGRLEVEFKTGRVYRYRRVPRTEFLRLLQADSKGRYFNARIRDRYAYSEIS